MKETELAEIVIAWLEEQHWEIYQEVKFWGMGGVADIVAVRQGILWIIETKTAMSIQVLNQASAWPAHFRSIAVPASIQRGYANDRRDYRVASDYYLVGVIEVSENNVSEVQRPPTYLRHHQTAKEMIGQLTDLHKSFSKAGSARGGHLTPYKKTMLQIRAYIEKHPGATIQDLFNEGGSFHYSSKASFKGNILKCLEDYEKDWCKIVRTRKEIKLFIQDGAPEFQQTSMLNFYNRKLNNG